MANYTISDLKDDLDTARTAVKAGNYTTAMQNLASARLGLLGLPDHEFPTKEGEERIEYHRQISDLTELIEKTQRMGSLGSRTNVVDFTG